MVASLRRWGAKRSNEKKKIIALEREEKQIPIKKKKKTMFKFDTVVFIQSQEIKQLQLKNGYIIWLK